MKNRLSIFVTSLLFIACHQVPESDATTAADKQQNAALTGDNFLIDTSKSYVTWVGTKVNGSHTGSIRIKTGVLSIKNNMVQGGRFVIDITSLVNDDLPPKEKAKIEHHLKSADFFDIASHPTSVFEITGTVPFNENKDKSILPKANHIIKGNLTLKGVTKNVTFPAVVTVENNIVTAHADFLINRTDWGMNYKGAKNPQNWLIKKKVNLKLFLTASKSQ